MTPLAFSLCLLFLLPAPLCDRLGHPSFRAREAAHRALAGLGRLALPALERSSKRHPSAEVRARCRALLAPYAWELAYRDAGRLRAKLPWIDARLHTGGWEEPVIVGWEHYLALAGRAGVRGLPPDYAEYREATRLWAAAQLVQRRPGAEIDATLDLLAVMEGDWERAHKR